MKFQSVLVVAMFAAGGTFLGAPAHADNSASFCTSFDSSCSAKQTCSTSTQCAADPFARSFSLTVCDASAGKCVTPWSSATGLGGALGGVTCGLVGALACNGSAPVCNTAGVFAGKCSECSASDATHCGTYNGARPVCMTSKGLCGCSADTDCTGGKTCNALLHQCVAPLTLPFGDAGTVIPGVDAGLPSSSSSSSGGSTGDDPTSPSDGAASSSSSSSSGSTATSTSASASVGDAGLDADTAVAADGGCSTGGHGSGVTFLGVLGAAFAFTAARRRRTAR